MYNPAIFVIVVESADRQKLYGGATCTGGKWYYTFAY